MTIKITSLDWHDGPVLQHSEEFPDESLSNLWTKAGHILDQLIFGSILPCWIEDDDRWKHATHDTIVARMESGEEPLGLFVDQDEFEAVAANTYPKDFSGFGSKQGWTTSELKEVTRRRGRPKYSGKYDDQPHLNEMRELLKTGEARSISQAADMVAPKAEGGGTDASKATRLRKAYVSIWRIGE